MASASRSRNAGCAASPASSYIAPSVPVAFDLEVLRRKGIEACVRDHRARTLDAALAAIREAAAEPASAAH